MYSTQTHNPNFKMNKKLLLMLAFSMAATANLTAQETPTGTPPAATDTIKKIKVVNSDTKEEKNRNVMLNAANNTGPREVNIGLPSTVGGITIQENDLPVVYFFWPELPNRTWRQSTSLGRTGLLKISEAAITTGDLGFAVNSYTKLGSDKQEVVGNLSGSHFGWLKGDVNISGPMGKNWFYTLGAYANYDPSTYDMKFAKYSDRTQIYRAGVTKRFNNGKGQINFLYKYANSASLTNYAIFKYKEGGKVEEVNDFRIGRDSYIVNDGTLKFKDLLTGKTKFADMGGSDAASFSHSFDVNGKYTLQNDWNFTFASRIRYAESSQLIGIPLGVFNVTAEDGYAYQKSGQAYTGAVNSMLGLYTDGTPTTTFLSRFEVKKTKNAHNMRIGFTEYYYNVDQFTSNRSFYNQTASAAPDKLVHNQVGSSSNTDADGFYNYNIGGEYHNGFENKMSTYFSDDWAVTDWFSVNYGINLRYQKIKGDYYLTPRTDGFVFDPSQKTYFDNDWFHIGGSVNTVLKVTKRAGVLLDFTYTQNNGQLESYSGFVTPNLSKTKSPLLGFGVYYNDKIFSVVSQATYLTRNNFQARLNLVNPDDVSQSSVATIFYDIQTLGWTTDVVASPFKGFSLHYLITFQNPVYKNYDFTAFGNNYSYNDKNVLEISKTLMEIDPSYSYKKFKVWASFRYFSKQFANLTNALYFDDRWETFGGVNYQINDHLDFGVTAVNFLNQTGAKGTINGAELITDASQYYDQTLVGSYIRPFTLEASLNFRF
ncbi:TonB-dependent receptor [Flavobacterium subsaxonicum WB 4.1-42 = DSM 21790]|uniref:TonB-dependent receptor n=2 Tax=Flavobacterium TaxID=237 RepID=A0A0A2MI03_9FLAO|nr:TonB-dependent receptor [Flavobacterium subsaxonicum WB 4.1-42 = DSM 21790]